MMVAFSLYCHLHNDHLIIIYLIHNGGCRVGLSSLILIYLDASSFTFDSLSTREFLLLFTSSVVVCICSSIERVPLRLVPSCNFVSRKMGSSVSFDSIYICTLYIKATFYIFPSIDKTPHGSILIVNEFHMRRESER
jgi:hypothetical protein